MTRRRTQIPSTCLAFLSLCAVPCVAEDPCVSGLKVGQKPGPYSFVVATGPERGQSTCYVCETADRPAVVVFARNPSELLGKLVARFDTAVADNRKADLRGWVTFLSDDQPSLDPQLVAWGKKHAIRQMPIGVFESEEGPLSYRLAREADVTVLLFVKKKVVANFAFRSGELNDEQIARVEKALSRMLQPDK